MTNGQESSRISDLASPAPIAGIPGPGRWLVAEYQPTALFSLKASFATSSVGRTLVIPTPYAIKMALVDAAFRAGLSDFDCAELLRDLIKVEVRIGPGVGAVVTHTFVKIRQESRDPDSPSPYSSTIAYRELAHLQGVIQWAFDMASIDDSVVARLLMLLPHISYIGKRGSFIQFVHCRRLANLDSRFTQTLVRGEAWSPPKRAHIVSLDDFGPEADLETLSSFTRKRPRRNLHRRFVETIVPLGIVNTGPGFTLYSRD